MKIESEVEQLFLHSWLKVHKFEVEQLDLRSKKKRNDVVNEIGCPIIESQLKSDYEDFKKSGKTVENYFDVDILFCKQNGQNNFCAINREPLNRNVIILFRTKKDKFDFANHPIITKAPIEMSLKSILSIYGISETVKILPLQEINVRDLEDKYQICLDLYRKVGNMGQLHYDFPGFREPTWTPKHRIKIAIDHMEIPYLPKFYWIPCDQLITTEHFCTKMPGKCGYSTFKLCHLERHEKTCSDETKIVSKQVFFSIFDSYIKII